MRPYNALFLLPLLLLLFTCQGPGMEVTMEPEDPDDDPIDDPVEEPLFDCAYACNDINFLRGSGDYDDIVYLDDQERTITTSTQEQVTLGVDVWKIYLSEGDSIEVWMRTLRGQVDEAADYVVAIRMGLTTLPPSLRDSIDQVIVSSSVDDDPSFNASGNLDLNHWVLRDAIFENDAEELIFTNMARNIWRPLFEDSEGWRNAQMEDDRFITNSGENSPENRDFLETILFVYTLEEYPNNLQPFTRAWIVNNIPNKYRFLVEEVLE